MAIVSTKDKGTQIMDGMLLSQYKESPLLREYLLAYISEMDLLFQSIEEVHFGRLLEHAVGAQLDIIGVILQQSRDVVLPKTHFGFIGAPAVDGMADEATPLEGGIFLSENQAGLSTTPLNDFEYRGVLYCKGYLLNKDDIGVETFYEGLFNLLQRVPDITISYPSDLHIDITINNNSVTAREQQLILYMAKYLIPAAVTLNLL